MTRLLATKTCGNRLAALLLVPVALLLAPRIGTAAPPRIGPSAAGPAPSGCIPATGTWCDTTGRACTANAGSGSNTACGERDTDEWFFAEGAPCRDCTYVFYVLVECGRELHLPLSDMERTKIQVTDLLNGRARPLRCVNGTARAEASGGPRPSVIAMECDGLPGLEEWWGPAFDATDNAAAGQVVWGYPACDDLLGAYDVNRDGIIQCGELPAGGGLLDRLSPGEGQVMDCFVADASAACGLYRVEIVSGGQDWRLFANCDGSPLPGLQIYFDCADAWAAYNPLPELTLENLVVTGACPDVIASVTVRNVGCAPTTVDVPLRFVTDCTPADVVSTSAPGPIAPGDAVRIDVPLTVSCNPATVTVTVDPVDAILECGETGTNAACRAQGAQDALTAPACGCVTTTAADAGPDREVCSRGAFTLTGAVSLRGCAASEHRWLDAATSMPLGPWSASLDSPPLDPDCSGGRGYVFETRCAGVAGDCPDSDAVSVTCIPPPGCFPYGDGSCRSPDARAGLNCSCRSNTLFMDKDTSVDADGNGDPTDDHDIEFACNVLIGYPAPGYYTFRTWYDFNGCVTWVDALVDVNVLPFEPAPTATLGCPGEPVTLDCGVSQSGTDYTWDLDVSVDSDGNSNPADDVDATGCTVMAALTAGTYTARAFAVEWDEPTCLSSAEITFDVPPGSTSGLEVTGLRLSRTGAALGLTWAPLALADSYRVVRGDIGTWYGHRADDPAGIGACIVPSNAHVDPDDAALDGAARYYLVGAAGCGAALGPLGDAWDGRSLIPRPPPIPTASCP